MPVISDDPACPSAMEHGPQVHARSNVRRDVREELYIPLLLHSDQVSHFWRYVTLSLDQENKSVIYKDSRYVIINLALCQLPCGRVFEPLKI